MNGNDFDRFVIDNANGLLRLSVMDRGKVESCCRQQPRR
jgi:hypothetical protein